MSPKVKVLFFATAREATGIREMEESIPAEGVRAEDLLVALESRFPRLARVRRTSRVVRNGTYLRSTSAMLYPGDVVAIHPPYSGG